MGYLVEDGLSQKLADTALIGCDGVGGLRDGASDDDVVTADLAGTGRRGDTYLVVLGSVGKADAGCHGQKLGAAVLLDETRLEG